MSKVLELTLEVWRQDGPGTKGAFETYTVEIPDDASFLEMLDKVNENLFQAGQEPITFDHDCREGICGSCGVMIDGQAHGPQKGTATCQLHMRQFSDGQTIRVEPWRAAGFPIIKDLMVNRAAFDRIVESGGYITVTTGAAPDANEIPVPKDAADSAMDAAACIGCGACVAACPNSAANLFTAAKMQHLNQLPQGQAERWRRSESMVETMEEFFGSCTNHGECQEACPKEITIDFIAMMNRDYLRSKLVNRRRLGERKIG
ncbi:MAG: succinate dehydrogenase/fumarate reductase iron-sulfur subunit [Microthrixaceae bacterium]|nr:succinate dehydrogenase/fumarate reductase iron-sulfur subunit [Microthrixaceae bacterium]MCB9387730.1 succinate dehydrogenase/fumarate reductase iron-sulfur subunit [Microthrixaceae bacterium]MCO5322491.1 succinate dehydrogenase/fumarate reductase iron-sulfur subunit [Microthrixaceae bacterium]